MNLADYNSDSYRDIIQEAGIAITPYSSDRWFPATCANICSSGYISGRTGDFYAKMYLLTLCSAYAFPINEKVRKEYKADENRKQDQKISRINAIAMTKDILIAMLLRKDYNVAIRTFVDVVSKTREFI